MSVFSGIYNEILAVRLIGLTPVAVYVGADEVQEMLLAASVPVRDEGTVRTVYGVPFFVVNAPSHLAVRGVWERAA